MGEGGVKNPGKLSRVGSHFRGNYSREETIQGRKLFAEIRYILGEQK
jgi:hypothetical protein